MPKTEVFGRSVGGDFALCLAMHGGVCVFNCCDGMSVV